MGRSESAGRPAAQDQEPQQPRRLLNDGRLQALEHLPERLSLAGISRCGQGLYGDRSQQGGHQHAAHPDENRQCTREK
jgi:hypothetical protein